ncbi:MAG: hypothetical protein U1D30_16555 [Planctomycetota bacterium]
MRKVRFSYSLWILCVFSICLSSCARRTTPSKPSTNGGDRKEQQSNHEAEQLLRSVLTMLESRTDESTFDTVLKQLNQFMARSPDAVGGLKESEHRQIVTLLGPQAAAQAAKREFSLADTEYLRGMMFLRTIAKSLEKTDNEELAYASRVFDWTMEQVSLVPQGWLPDGPPMDVCLRGTGSANERSWIFLELLRQSGLHGCVVGVPAADHPESIIPWLCGVLAKDEVYLFEPTLGVPVLSPSGKVATLKELTSNPQILDSLKVDESPYPVSKEQAKQFSLLLIVQTEMLTPRMAFLESRLSGQLRANLTLDFSKELARASAALKDIPGNQGVRVWQYPQLVISLFTADKRPFYRSVNLTWFKGKTSPRLAQLLGKYQDAIDDFVKLDMENLSANAIEQMMAGTKVPLEYRRTIQALTPQDVLYFTGQCQLDQPRAQPNIAYSWFRRYLDRFGSYSLNKRDVLDAPGMLQSLRSKGQESTPSPARRVTALLPDALRATLFQIAVTVEAISKMQSLSPDDLSPVDALEKAVVELKEKAKGLPADSRLVTLVGEYCQALDHAIVELRAKRSAETGMRKARDTITEIVRESLNPLLEKRDFYSASDMESALTAPSSTGELRAFVAADASSLTDPQIIRRNRLLLSVCFPEYLLPGQRTWIAASIRESALALKKQGKDDEAIRLLKENNGALLSMERAQLLALARVWERRELKSGEPKAGP